MSLTSFIKLPKVRRLFNEEIPKPLIENRRLRITVPPSSKAYSTIGTSFDYLLRFRLEREFSIAKTSNWNANSGMGLLPDDMLKKYIRHFAEAVLAYDKFKDNGRITKKLLSGVFFLAQLDNVYRSHYVPDSFRDPTEGELSELRALLKRIPLSAFQPKKYLILNPTFRTASVLVGGADADLVVDDTIIEIKTTKERRLHRSYFNQLIGYYMLSRIDGVRALPRWKKIKKIGVYWSRYCQLDTWLIHDIASESEFEVIQTRFEELAKKKGYMANILGGLLRL